MAKAKQQMLPRLAADVRVPALPVPFSGQMAMVAAVHMKGRRVVLVKDADGRVYGVLRGYDMADRRDVSDDVRRAWCKLTGTKLADLKAHMAARAAADLANRKAAALHTIRENAAAAGFRLVRDNRLQGSN